MFLPYKEFLCICLLMCNSRLVIKQLVKLVYLLVIVGN